MEKEESWEGPAGVGEPNGFSNFQWLDEVLTSQVDFKDFQSGGRSHNGEPPLCFPISPLDTPHHRDILRKLLLEDTNNGGANRWAEVVKRVSHTILKLSQKGLVLLLRFAFRVCWPVRSLVR